MDHPASAQSFNQALIFKSKMMHKRPSITKSKPQVKPKQAEDTQQQQKIAGQKIHASQPQPSKRPSSKMITQRPVSVKGSKVPVKNIEIEVESKVPRKKEKIKEIEKESECNIIRNLRSKHLEWSFVNLLLEKSNERMKQQSMDENYDRFLQIMGIQEENQALKKRIFLSQIIQTIDTSLHIQYDLLPEIISYMDQIRSSTHSLNQKLQNSLNRIMLGSGISLDIASLSETLKNAAVLLQEVNSQLECEGIQEVANELDSVRKTMQAQEKEMKQIVSDLRERRSEDIIRQKQSENLQKFVEQL